MYGCPVYIDVTSVCVKYLSFARLFSIFLNGLIDWFICLFFQEWNTIGRKIEKTSKEKNQTIRSATNVSFEIEICRTSEEISRCTLRKEILRTRKYAIVFGHFAFSLQIFSFLAPEYESKIFLDCCGLVRRVMYDLAKEFGFIIGPWNQSYMYDTLPQTVTNLSDVKPGDLVFISAIYYNQKSE